MPRCRSALITTLLVGPLVAPASSSAVPLGERNLDRGDRGSDVRTLQRALVRAGAGRVRADGVFGRQTHRAVYRYERRRQLRVDGWVSTGQARGLLRRVGMPVPPAGPRRLSAPRSAAPDGSGRTFPVRGPVTWGDGVGDRGGGHQGADLMADCGVPLVALDAARVVRVATHSAAGRYVVLREAATGEDWAYMHLQDVDVTAGDELRSGGPVGTVGQTGNASACHLHVERWAPPGWQRGEVLDPEPVLRPLAP